MLSGNNNILGRATDAKIKTERAQIEEAAKLAYASAVMDKYTANNSTGLALSNVVKALSDQGYKTKSVSAGTTTITGLKLQENGNDITDINIEKDNGAIVVKVVPITSSGDTKSHYIQINGLWYEITLENEEIEISENGVKEVSSGEVDLSGKITATIASTATATIPSTISGDTIEITPVEKGNTTITINAEGVSNPLIANISVKQLAKLKEINIGTEKGTTLYLDGASLITATLDDTNESIATSVDVKWTSSNPNVATVTANGIVMAGKQTGNTTITCTGANNTTQTCPVESTACIYYTNSGTTNTSITGKTGDEAGFNYDNPVVPAGFSAVNTNDAKWTFDSANNKVIDYNKGLVIMDSKGNQFVWVPVDGTIVKYEKWCTNGTAYNSSNITGDELPIGITDENAQITKYKGFYIGRYEAGLDVDLGSSAQKMADATNRNKSTIKPIIVEGASPWNYINYTNSKENAERMYSNSAVQSGLLTGTQWDTTMKFIQDIGGKREEEDNVNINSKGWGNYGDSELTLNNYKWASINNSNRGGEWEKCTTSDLIQLLRTGASNETKVLNISDMAGNLSEWTSEIYSSDYVIRGGDYNFFASRSAGNRRNSVKGELDNKYGFRVMLYVK